MESSESITSGDRMQSEQKEVGHLFPGGHLYLNAFGASRPPYWGQVPRIPFQGYGPRPFLFPPLPFPCGPPIFNVPPPCIPSLDIQSAPSMKNEDEARVNKWLKSRSFLHPSRPSGGQTVPIFKVRERVQKCISVLNSLSKVHCDLQKGKSTLSKAEWNAAWSCVEEKKSEISSLANTVLTDETLKNLQKGLTKRKRKRSRQKRQLARLRKDAYLVQLRRQSLHKKADAWLADMHLAVDRARKDEVMKREADSVLAEVTRQQFDGRRQISLLEALEKLHQARIQTLEGRGSKLSSEDKRNAEHSALVFTRLKAMWSSKMKEYGKEESSLRRMLEESAAKQSDLELQNICSLLTEWEICLFGSEDSLTSDHFNINSLVSIRYAWDQYIVPDTLAIPMASTIPVGWVLPTTPSSSEWQKWLNSQ